MKAQNHLAIKRALVRKRRLELVRTVCAVISTILGILLTWHVLLR